MVFSPPSASKIQQSAEKVKIVILSLDSDRDQRIASKGKSALPVLSAIDLQAPLRRRRPPGICVM